MVTHIVEPGFLLHHREQNPGRYPGSHVFWKVGGGCHDREGRHVECLDDLEYGERSTPPIQDEHHSESIGYGKVKHHERVSQCEIQRLPET